MRVPCDVICKVCKKIFCCVECTYKHELKNHAIIVRTAMNSTEEGSNNTQIAFANVITTYLFCPLCEKKPLVLREEFYNELLEHIEMNHLPLHCRKCAKVYYKIEELKEFSECLHSVKQCNEIEQNQYSRLEPSGTFPKMISQTTISTQTSPMVISENNIDTTTPISIINLRWKAATQCHKLTPDVFVSDSVSSIRNISSICNNSSLITRSTDMVPKVKGKLVRSTSTPVNAGLFFTKPKEHTFSATRNQVSICYSTSNESDNSPALLNPSGASPKLPPDNVNRHLKGVGGRPKVSAVTPLRHVMSKSIQKAFAEHGGLPTTTIRSTAFYNRKVMFDFSDSNPSSTSTLPGSPLDLRLSPAIRRTQDDVCNANTINKSPGSLTAQAQRLRREIMLSSKKLTTESIVITRTRHLANVETSSTTSSSSATTSTTSTCLSSIKPNYGLSNNTVSENSTSSNSSSSSSVFKTCSSIEIITATTELSEVNIHQDAAYISDGINKELKPLKYVETVTSNSLAAITPITRIPGAVASKKIIEFVETPIVEIGIENINSKTSPGEVFFTPNSTPIRKTSLQRNSSTDSDTKEQYTKMMPRKLNRRFSPSRRPPLREYNQSLACNHIENVAENYDDEVFTPTEASTEQEDKENKNCNDRMAAPVGQSWSLSAFVSSVMRLPSLAGASSSRIKDHTGVKNNGNSLLKRCASIAGSFVRPKSLLDAEHLGSLKRKRTNTYDNSSIYLSPCNSSSDTSLNNTSISSKRFRIQGRKPIDRMRMNS